MTDDGCAWHVLFIRIHNYLDRSKVDPSSRNVGYRFKGVARDGCTFDITDDSSYHPGASVFLLSCNGARWKGSEDRAPAASLNKRWNLILCLRLAIEGPRS